MCFYFLSRYSPTFYSNIIFEEMIEGYEKNEFRTDNEINSMTPPDAELSRSIIKEKIILNKEVADDLYFIELNATIEIKTVSVPNVLVPNTIQKKDFVCIRSTNRHSKIVLIQIWDKLDGIHARIFVQQIRFASVCFFLLLNDLCKAFHILLTYFQF